MKSFPAKAVFFSLCLFSFLQTAALEQSPALLTGIYLLEGSNSDSERINYRGEVEIQQNGSNYLLTWRIGNSQVQTGIGILKDHILSVAYYDLSGKSTGVISFSLTGPDRLEGSWAGYGATSFGREWLTFKPL